MHAVMKGGGNEMSAGTGCLLLQIDYMLGTIRGEYDNIADMMYTLI